MKYEPYTILSGDDWIFKGEKEECDKFLEDSIKNEFLDTDNWIITENKEDFYIISKKWST